MPVMTSDFSHKPTVEGLYGIKVNPFQQEDEMIDWFRDNTDLVAIRRETKMGFKTWTDRAVLPYQIMNKSFRNSAPPDDWELVSIGVMNPCENVMGSTYTCHTSCEAQGIEYFSYIDYFFDEKWINMGRIISIDDDILAFQFKLTFSEAL
jgi:hypothetical protein